MIIKIQYKYLNSVNCGIGFRNWKGKMYYFYLEINPLDYVYKSLGCHVELLDPKSEECQLILEYIHNSRK